MRAIGRTRGFTLDVDDLDVGAEFWSLATGMPISRPGCAAGCVVLRNPVPDPRIPQLTLRRATITKTAEVNHAHIDLTPREHDAAIARAIELGARRKTTPTVYPRPHSPIGGRPLIEWSVLEDPFGNEFCLVRDLERAEREALQRAAENGDGDDEHWRSVAREARQWNDDEYLFGVPLPDFEGVGSLRNFAVDVEDIPVALHFWSAAIGQPVIGSDWPNRYAYVGEEHEPDHWSCHLILHGIKRRNPDLPCRAHLDIDVEDLHTAAAQIEFLCDGVIERRDHNAEHAPGCPHAAPHVRAKDPFGNELCLVLVEN